MLIFDCSCHFIDVIVFVRECLSPTLKRFAGDAKNYSPRARFRHLLGWVDVFSSFAMKYIVVQQSTSFRFFDFFASIKFA